MHIHGSLSDRTGSGIVARAGAWETARCARSVSPHHVRHNPAPDAAARRLAELDDRTRPTAARCAAAVAFSHELDAVFIHATRLPRLRLHGLTARYDRLLYADLIPRLATEGVTFPDWEELSSRERLQIQRRFHERTFPLFTPMAVDATHPVPHLPSLAINVGLQVDGRLCVVRMSPHVPRLLPVCRGRYLPVESFVGALLPRLLVGVRVADYTTFRVTRSAHTDEPVRLETESRSSSCLVDMLAARLGVADADVYRSRTSLSMGAALATDARRSTPA